MLHRITMSDSGAANVSHANASSLDHRTTDAPDTSGTSNQFEGGEGKRTLAYFSDAQNFSNKALPEHDHISSRMCVLPAHLDHTNAPDDEAFVIQNSEPVSSISQPPHRHLTELLPHCLDASFGETSSLPYHQCRQLCHFVGCFATAPWVQQLQNAQDEQCCAPEIQFLCNESRSGLRRVLCAERAAFEGVDQGRVGLLNFKQFLDALNSLRVHMPYHHRLALFANSDSNQDGLITRSEFSTAYLRILLFSSNSCP